MSDLITNLDEEKLLDNLSLNNKFQKQFLEKRAVFFWGQVDDRSAKEAIDKLLYLEAIDPGKEITMYISSPGGVVTSGMVVYDTMQMITSPVATVCMGMAASMGSILLAGGAKGKRSIFPSGKVMIHQPSMGGAYGQASDIEITAKQIVKTRERLGKILADNTGKTLEQITKDFNRDYWMDAKESLDYGIVDNILDKIEF